MVELQRRGRSRPVPGSTTLRRRMRRARAGVKSIPCRLDPRSDGGDGHVSRFAGVPTISLSPTEKARPDAADFDIGRAGARIAESSVRLACVPTRVTVTVSIPWPTLSMSNRILSPAEMLATEVTLMLVAPACASAAS